MQPRQRTKDKPYGVMDAERLAGHDRSAGGIRQLAEGRGDARHGVHERVLCRANSSSEIIVRICWAVFLAGLLLAAAQAQAQDYPLRHISLIIPAGPGAPPDTIARIVSEPMSARTRPASRDRKCAGLGRHYGRAPGRKRHTRRLHHAHAASGTHAGAPALYPNLGFDPTESFEQVGLVALTYVLLVGRKQLAGQRPAASFIAYLRANEKAVTEGHGGVGSISHVACTYFHALSQDRSDARAVPRHVRHHGRAARRQHRLSLQPVQQHRRAGAAPDGVKAFAVSAERRLPQIAGGADRGRSWPAGLQGERLVRAARAPRGTPSAISGHAQAARSTMRLTIPMVAKAHGGPGDRAGAEGQARARNSARAVHPVRDLCSGARSCRG